MAIKKIVSGSGKRKVGTRIKRVKRKLGDKESKKPEKIRKIKIGESFGGKKGTVYRQTLIGRWKGRIEVTRRVAGEIHLAFLSEGEEGFPDGHKRFGITFSEDKWREKSYVMVLTMAETKIELMNKLIGGE